MATKNRKMTSSSEPAEGTKMLAGTGRQPSIEEKQLLERNDE
jgi:hypothetical protein